MTRAIGPDPSPRAEQASDWCLRIAERSLAPEEVAEFESWMATDPANREAFDRATFAWRALDGRAAPPELVDIRMDALASLHANDERAATPRRRFAFGWGHAAGIAAAFVMIALAGLYLLTSGPALYETGIGERRIVMLEDGSRLSLDAASSVSVDYSDDRRRLRLVRGRARFDVARDPLRPFSVAAGDKLIVATGTSFSVELLARRLEVVLYEGHVSVLRGIAGAAPRPIAAVQGVPVEQLLRPGSQAVIPAGAAAATLVQVDLPRTQSWETGQLSFIDEPLASAVERMNRYAQTQLVIGDPGAGRIEISGVFNTDDPASFIEGITGVFPLRSERRGNRIVLTSAR